MNYYELTPDSMNTVIQRNCYYCEKFKAMQKIYESFSPIPTPNPACIAAIELEAAAEGVLDMSQMAKQKKILGCKKSAGKLIVPLRCQSFCEIKPAPKPVAKNQLSLLCDTF
jgi:hypothetical protein